MKAIRPFLERNLRRRQIRASVAETATLTRSRGPRRDRSIASRPSPTSPTIRRQWNLLPHFTPCRDSWTVRRAASPATSLILIPVLIPTIHEGVAVAMEEAGR